MARNNSIDSYIDTVGIYFAKLPQLPKGGREAVVMITPWLALIFGVLGVITALVALGIFTFLAPIAVISGVSPAGAGFVVAILGLIASVLLIAGFPGVRALQEKGWKLIYYSQVAGLVADIITFSLGGVLFALIGFYFLYQIRSYYK